MIVETDFQNKKVKVNGLEIVDITFDIHQFGDKYGAQVFYRDQIIGTVRAQRHHYKVANKVSDIINIFANYELEVF